MKKAIHLLSIFLLVLAACDKNENNNQISSPPVPIQIDSFPLTIGNAWKYHTEVTLKDNSGQIISASSYDNYWKVISDTNINGLNSIKIQQLDSNYNGSVNIGYTYYANQLDGLYGVGIENFGSMFEMKESFPIVPVLLFNVLQPDTIFIPITPIKVLDLLAFRIFGILLFISVQILYLLTKLILVFKPLLPI